MRALPIISILFLFSISFLKAQPPYPSNLGSFTLSEVKGCAPLTITINADTCQGSVFCIVLTEKGDKNTALPPPFIKTGTITYTTAGIHIPQLVIGLDNGANFLPVEVVPNIAPDFDVYTCKGDKVSLKVNDTNYDTYFIDYGDGVTITLPSGSAAKDVHTFGSGGTHAIAVKGVNIKAADNCVTNSQTVDVDFPSTTSIDKLTVATTSEIDLDFPSSNLSVLYKMDIAVNSATSFQQLKSLHNTHTTAVSNSVKPDDNYYCFRMTPIDYCTNTPSVPAVSNTICSANFDVTAQSNVNKMTWVTAAAGIADFSIAKTPGSALTASSTASSLDDTDILCKTPYTYQLISDYGNGSKSYSLAKNVTAFSSTIPTMIENTTAVVGNGTGVDLQWLGDPVFTASQFSVFRSTSFSTLLGKTTTPQINDPNYTTEGNFCYAISYQDACDNNSPLSGQVCPIRLTGTLQKDNTINLSWPSYNGWKNGVSNYTVEKYSSNGTLLQTFNTNSATTLLDNAQDLSNQLYTYVVKATANDSGLGIAVSNTLTIIKEPNLFYPTAFTPDHLGPGENEVFKVFGQYVNQFEMKIFNRWGELLYSTNNLDDSWDGTFKGNPMPEGTYAFIAKITDEVGRTFNRSGSVVLLRKN